MSTATQEFDVSTLKTTQEVFAAMSGGHITQEVAEKRIDAIGASAVKNAKKSNGADKPTVVKLGEYKGYPMVELTGNFKPINIGVGKARKILGNAKAVQAVIDLADSQADADE